MLCHQHVPGSTALPATLPVLPAGSSNVNRSALKGRREQQWWRDWERDGLFFLLTSNVSGLWRVDLQHEEEMAVHGMGEGKPCREHLLS